LEDKQARMSEFFSNSPGDRLKLLEQLAAPDATAPPIVFPWEVFAPQRGFVTEDEFIFVKESNEQAENLGRSLYQLYKRIWESAKDSVMNAKKISFVGLSAHPYMVEGLSYLFRGKHGGCQIVVANPVNSDYRESRNRLHPASLCGRMYQILKRVAPDMICVGSSSEDDGTFSTEGMDENTTEPSITARYSFKEFIEREMT